MDHVAINAAENMLRIGLDRDAAALLIGSTDSQQAGSGSELETMLAACEANGATEVLSTSDAAEAESLIIARRSAVPALEREGRMLLEDVGVPLPGLLQLVDGITAIAARRGLTIALIAHAGDGNTHPLIVVDPRNRDMAARADRAFGEIMELAISLGGTITGEHGVGRLKRPWLASQLGPRVMDLSARIKHALDPLGILNPGALFDADADKIPGEAKA